MVVIGSWGETILSKETKVIFLEDTPDKILTTAQLIHFVLELVYRVVVALYCALLYRQFALLLNLTWMARTQSISTQICI